MTHDSVPIYDEHGNRMPGDMTGKVGLHWDAWNDHEPEDLTLDALKGMLRDEPSRTRWNSFEERWPIIQAWLAEGFHIAVYRNCLLGHPDEGVHTLVTFGPGETHLGDIPRDDLPRRHSSKVGEDAWMYLLVGSYFHPEKG